MGEGTALLVEDDVNLLAGIFLVGIFWGFFIPKVSYKGSGEVEAVHTYWGQQSKVKGGDTLGQIKGVKFIILGDNPAEQCFVLGV